MAAATTPLPGSEASAARRRRVLLRGGLFAEWIPAGARQGARKRARTSAGSATPTTCSPTSNATTSPAVSTPQSSSELGVTPTVGKEGDPGEAACGSDSAAPAVEVTFPTNLSTRRVKQLLPEHVSYTELHLTLAHMKRLSRVVPEGTASLHLHDGGGVR